ncbi:uncharacterized protein LOC119740341 [Patiria miniata]|uniref:Uncharacterized protein n=1 Tax=Patiria miniata TaxID=46514 RepID=A0A914B6E5_PATMI|nr:uncharacterized protein LOC119740341 [Patiria miniata]
MKGFLVFLPLLGFVAAQMNGHMGGAGQMNGHMGAAGQQNDPFFNDFGKGTGSKIQPAWAAPPRQSAPFGNGGNQAGQSSTTAPKHNPIPVGGPQVANNNPYANADPNAKTGSSGELAGFGNADVFHAVLDGNNAGAVGGAQPLPGPGTGRSSGTKKSLVDYNMYELPPDDVHPTISQNAGEGEAGIQIGAATDLDTGVGPASAEKINPYYFGDGLGVPGGGYRGPLLSNGRLSPAIDSPDIPKPVGAFDGLVPFGGGGGAGTNPDQNGGGNLLDDDQVVPHGASVGPIVGALFGVVIVGLVVGAVAVYVRKKRRHSGYCSPI